MFIKSGRPGRRARQGASPYAVLAALAAAASLAACSPKPSGPLRFAVLPDADSLPFLVADAEGDFVKEGVAVELVAFKNPQERDAAFQAGQVDGAISDVLAAAFAVAGGFPVRITSVTDGRYGIAAAPGSWRLSARDLAGSRIGLSTNTIIQYFVDTRLKAAGVTRGGYTALAVPKMPVRLEMLLTGQLDAAGLPEPLLSVAAARGAIVVETSEEAGTDVGVVLFAASFLDARSRDVIRFYKAYDAARKRINADPDAYRGFLVEKAAFPEETRNSYSFVKYRPPVLPSQDQVDAVLAWMREGGLLSRDVTAREMLDDRVAAKWK